MYPPIGEDQEKVDLREKKASSPSEENKIALSAFYVEIISKLLLEMQRLGLDVQECVNNIGDRYSINIPSLSSKENVYNHKWMNYFYHSGEMDNLLQAVGLKAEDYRITGLTPGVVGTSQFSDVYCMDDINIYHSMCSQIVGRR
jgi:hypothetical protein